MRTAAVLALAAISLAPAPSTYPPVAVVELFTSEGCSSCPPADELLLQIAKEARKSGKAVYPLAYHVDYWDDLGWKDPRASPAYTERQREYDKVLDVASPYTPQMIVNGRTGFVGSRRGSAQWAIDKALERGSTSSVRITSVKRDANDRWTFAARVTGAAQGDRAVWALAQREIEVKVKAGENGGRTLHHGEVVRALGTALVGRGDFSFSVQPPYADGGTFSIVVFVQRPGSLEITGATSANLGGPRAASLWPPTPAQNVPGGP